MKPPARTSHTTGWAMTVRDARSQNPPGLPCSEPSPSGRAYRFRKPKPLRTAFVIRMPIAAIATR